MTKMLWHAKTGELKVFADDDTAPDGYIDHHPADTAKAPAAEAPAKGRGKAAKPAETPKLREDGPTVEQYVKAGYRASNYPPEGYAPRSTPEEITAAVEAEKAGE